MNRIFKHRFYFFMYKNAVRIIFILAITAAVAGGGFYFSQRNKSAAPPDNLKDSPASVDPKDEDNTMEVKKTDGENNNASDTDNPIVRTAQEDEIKINDDIADTENNGRMERFVIAIGQNSVDTVAGNLLEQGFIDDAAAFKGKIKPGILALVGGGYKISKEMDEAQIAKVLQDAPYMKWIIVPEGLRKEEVAQMLANELGWTASQKDTWIKSDTSLKTDYIEGVYFPDTYLIPTDEEPAKISQRMQTRFNEKFGTYLPEFNRQNIKWTTGLTFASIVQREAKNDADMPLIAGILWNRLEQGMTLDADATLQYARGDTGAGWWAPAGKADKSIDSPFNTYTNKGLPPRPICSPGIAAIEATLNPQATDCLYYLHGNDGATHCAATYEEHLKNIESYLKNTD